MEGVWSKGRGKVPGLYESLGLEEGIEEVSKE